MQLQELIDKVQDTLADAGVHFTQSGVSTTINDANKLMALFTLYHERVADTHTWTISSQWPAFVALPSDCIVPLVIRDTSSGSRVFPVSFSDLALEDQDWWRLTGTSAKYYVHWNPLRSATHGSHGFQRHAIMLYPRVASASLHMLYAAVPPTLSSLSDECTMPEGLESGLADYAIGIGMIRADGQFEVAQSHIKDFFDSVASANELLRERYPGGRDFEPPPIENIINRHMEQPNDRRRTRRRG